MNTTRHRRTIAAFVAFAAIAAAPLGQAIAAGPGDTNNVALIDANSTAQLDIHKFAGAPIDGAANNGTKLDAATLTGKTAVKDVTFKATLVTGVDLKTNAGWEAAKTYHKNVEAAKAALSTNPGDSKEATTDVNGDASFKDLALGLYYVEETAAPAGYTKAAPFVVTLPMTDPTKLNEWMYTVHVYPKNTHDTITKEVTDQGTLTKDTVGSTKNEVSYVIKTSITDGLANGAAMGYYSIHDKLDARVSYKGVAVELSNGTTLTRGTDYKVFINDALTATDPAAPTAGGPHVRISFTAAGLTKLRDNSAADVVATMTVIADSTGANGVLKNTADFIPNKAWYEQQSNTMPYNPDAPKDTNPNPGTTTPGLPSNEVESRYGLVQINKFDAAETATKLAGAEFTLYKGKLSTDATPTCTSADVVVGNKIAGPVTTDGSGVATFAGVQLSNYYNGKDQTDLQTYCAVETKAPTGYNLNAQPIAFYVTNAGTGTPKVLDVANQKSNLGNSLPLTGGGGVGLLSAVGLLLGAAGVGYYYVNSRREDDADEAELDA